MPPERKAVALELKADAEGSLRAIFSTFNVIDKDGDVTLPGAFTEGEQVRLLPAHNWAHYAIGKGAIHGDEQRAVFDGTFNLKTTAGRDWYESVKDLGQMQEWSYGFDVVEAAPGEWDGQSVRILKKLKVHEVSPVTLGAGVGTGTVDIKTFTEAVDHADSLVSGLRAFAERVRDRTDLRAKEGRVLSEANRDRIKGHLESLRGIAGDIEELLTATEKPPKQRVALNEYLTFQRSLAHARDLGVLLEA